MNVAIQAVKFYCYETGYPWSQFYDKLDEALASDAEGGELWLIKKLMKVIEQHGISVHLFKANKDVVKGEFDAEARDKAGEFFTPEIWAAKARTYFDKYIPNWHEMNIWDGSCGSGNLMRTAKHPADKLFLSSLQEDDITLIKNTPEYAGVTAFQCDFLKDIDYDVVNTDFLNKLPPRLKEIIMNDEPLIIYMNPPYKAGMARATDVGNHMCTIGLSKPAYDIFYQFMWRVLHFVDMFNLKNTYAGIFGPSVWFTGNANHESLVEFEHCFEFIDGMCFPIMEFSGTTTSKPWSVCFTLWKSRGGYIKDDFRKDILLTKCCRMPDGSIKEDGKVLYETKTQKLTDWVAPKDITFYKPYPLMTSHSTFKGSDCNVKVAPMSGKFPENGLGSMMVSNTFMDGAKKVGVLSTPTSMDSVFITPENFWRCVASFASRRVCESDWSNSKKNAVAPNTHIEGYEKWLYNGLVLMLVEYKAQMTGARNIDWEGTKFDVVNRLFFLPQDEIKEHTTDEVLLNDIATHAPANEFMLAAIEKAKPFWSEESWELYNWCKNYVFFTLDKRKDVNYTYNLDAWDAGFMQIRAGIWGDDIQNEYSDRLQAVRDYLRKDIEKFGFMGE